MTETKDVKGVGPAMARELATRGITTAQDLASAPETKLTEVPGIGAATAPRLGYLAFEWDRSA